MPIEVGSRFVDSFGRVHRVEDVDDQWVLVEGGRSFPRDRVTAFRFLKGPPLPSWLRVGEKIQDGDCLAKVTAILESEVVLLDGFGDVVPIVHFGAQKLNILRRPLDDLCEKARPWWMEGTHIRSGEGVRYVRATFAATARKGLLWIPTSSPLGVSESSLLLEAPFGSRRIATDHLSTPTWFQNGAIVCRRGDAVFFEVSVSIPHKVVTLRGVNDPSLGWTHVPFDELGCWKVVRSPGLVLSRYERELLV